MRNLASGIRGLLVGLAVTALMLAGVAPARAAETLTVLHVFLAAGQSNMSGRGLPAGSTDDPADPRIFEFGASDRELQKAGVPLDMHDIATGLSPATTLAREYLKTQPGNVGVLLIPAAHGGTGFTTAASTLTWIPGAASAPELDLSALAVKQTLEGIAAAKASGRTVELKGVLWHQGENNATLTTSGYNARLDTVIAYFRSQLAVPNLPVVVGQMAPEGIAADPVRLNVDRSHRETPSRVPYTGFAAAMAGGTNTGDIIHFSRTGVEFLGKNYLSGYQQATAAAVVDNGSLNAQMPSIQGSAKVGAILTAVPGGWRPAPVTLAYQWYRSGTAISGAIGAAYTPVAGDLGATITVKVTGSKSGYPTVSKTSAATASIVKGTLAAPTPTIAGTRKVGSTLTAVPGTWGPAPVTLTYKWYRSGTLISDASSATYKLRSGDAGRTITVKVTGSKTAFNTASKTSPATATIAKGTLAAPIPKITGTAALGSTLTAVPGAWGPAPVTLTYRWYRSHVLISDATASTYKVRTGDAGRTITVKVTGSKTGYSTVTKESTGTKVAG
ncbi:sialate O-acetylesterase [Arthrobacter sp. LAR12-1-1.1]|uniref:sialate O-acetylesterase n=1 Tax=Arthrobacter sp. LAR12-1-1.1 TaxID=3135215 RepID=UPI0034312184